MTNQNKTFFIKTYGCQMNVHESEKIVGNLNKFGFEQTSDEDKADIIIFNTCCIRDTAEKKILGHIGQLKSRKKQNPNLIIAVCGCMTQQDKAGETLRDKYPFVDIVLGTHNIELIGEKVAGFIKKPVIEIIDEVAIAENKAITRSSGTNAWVNIIYGCNNFCTYCIVPYVRGRQRSRKPEDILAEVNQLIKSGYKEITLLGQNVNSYGQDLPQKTNFSQLLTSICALQGNFRLRFMTSHPKDMTDECIKVIAENGKLCKSIHLPIQSGSNDILKAMNRKYTREYYLDLLKKIRKIMPDCAITTDIIVGFPGETDDDFKQTLDLVKEVEFSAAFTFVYSRRKGTAADKMSNQISPEIKKLRIKQLVEMQNAITRKLSASYHDKVFTVLAEDRNEKLPNVYNGRTDSNRLVNFIAETNPIGQFVKIKITKSQSATLWGEIIDFVGKEA